MCVLALSTKKQNFVKINPTFLWSTFIIKSKRCPIEINVSRILNTHIHTHTHTNTQATLSNVYCSFCPPASQPPSYGWRIPSLRRQCSPTMTVNMLKICFPSFLAIGTKTRDVGTTNQTSPKVQSSPELPLGTEALQEIGVPGAGGLMWACSVQYQEHLGCELKPLTLCNKRGVHQTSSAGRLPSPPRDPVNQATPFQTSILVNCCKQGS